MLFTLCGFVGVIISGLTSERLQLKWDWCDLKTWLMWIAHEMATAHLIMALSRPEVTWSVVLHTGHAHDKKWPCPRGEKRAVTSRSLQRTLLCNSQWISVAGCIQGETEDACQYFIHLYTHKTHRGCCDSSLANRACLKCVLISIL